MLIRFYLFTDRPCLGSRILIREHFSRIVRAALAEFGDWKAKCREMAVLLVRNMLIYSEEYCTQNTELLLAALRKAIADENLTVSQTAKECCMLIGKHVYPMVWIDYLSDLMYHEFELTHLEVLRRLVNGCPVARTGEFVTRIVALMEFVLQQMNAMDRVVAAEAVGEILNKLIPQIA